MPDTNSFFPGWSGGGCSGTGQCILTINADTIVTATFNAEVKEEIKKESPQPQIPSVKPSEGIFTVQAGAFRNVSNAKAFEIWLKEKGYSAYMTLSKSKEGGKLYKVCIGKFTEREEAKTLSEKIRISESIQTFITSLQP
jgi:cell division septation protein DedD